jgi:hypothetical protein
MEYACNPVVGSTLQKSHDNEFGFVSQDLGGFVKDVPLVVNMGSVFRDFTFCGTLRPNGKRGQIACMKWLERV